MHWLSQIMEELGVVEYWEAIGSKLYGEFLSRIYVFLFFLYQIHFPASQYHSLATLKLMREERIALLFPDPVLQVSFPFFTNTYSL